MSRILREYIKGVLTEEVVSIRRADGSEGTYDVTFDKAGGISRGKLYKFSKDQLSALEDSRVREYTGISDAQILAKISSVKKAGGPVLAPLPSSGWPSVIVDAMLNYWGDAVEWAPVNRTGKGEAAMHLAFASSDAHEPDFVSADGSVKMSIKHFQNGGGTARSGDSPAVKTLTIKLLTTFDKLTGSKLMGMKTASGVVAREYLLNEFMVQKSPAERARAIKRVAAEVRPIVDELMTEVASEHGAMGILVLCTGNAEWMPAERGAELLHLDAVRNDLRAQFCYRPWLTEKRNTWQKVLDEMSQITPAALGGAAPPPPAKPAPPGKKSTLR